jgi:uncharacterized oxidoreductase
MRVSGNTVLITGGGSGIGLALAEEFGRRGNEVILCGRRLERLRAARERVPQAHIRVCDLSRASSRKALAGWLLSQFEGLNVLVNNAGIQRMVDFQRGEPDLADLNEEVATNLIAPVHLSTLLIPHLKRQKLAAIVNVSSGLAFTPLAVVPVYCATKAAIHSISLTMRYQLRETSVRVFEVAPPTVATALSGSRRRPAEDAESMSPGEAAAGILEALEKDEYEAALGRAAGLHKQREALFEAINP